MNRISIAIGAGLIVAGFASPTSAQRSQANIVAHVHVPHGDLDLTSEAGAKAMLARIDEAASKACGGKPVTGMAMDQVGQAKKREYRRCKAAAMNSGVSGLGAPRVRAAWLDQQSGSPGKAAMPVAEAAR